jgi:hypothetical protein
VKKNTKKKENIDITLKKTTVRHTNTYTGIHIFLNTIRVRKNDTYVTIHYLMSKQLKVFVNYNR